MDGTFRHELKYEITPLDYVTLRLRLLALLKPDPHAGPGGVYRIRSIYFDNYQDKALKEKQESLPRREKFRIRYYNDDTTRFVLEKKSKFHGLCHKRSTRLSADQCQRLLAGELDWGRDDPLLLEFSIKRREQLLRPRVMVSYRREPYLYGPGNVRVTVDSDIRSSLDTRNFFSPSRLDVGVADDPSRRILEVKYGAFLPQCVADLLQLGRVRQQSYSKYTACRRFG